MPPTVKSTITGSHGGIVLGAATYANPVTVGSGASIYSTTASGLAASTYWTIANYGSIGSKTADGISLAAGGFVENGVGGAISGTAVAGIYIKGSAKGTVENAGSITGKVGVDLLSTSGWVSNASTGVIAGGSASGGIGVYIKNAAGTVENAGSISGNVAIELKDGGLVSNAATGAITGTGTASVGVDILTATGTLDNSGAISGVKAVYFNDGGMVSNAASAAIAGGTAGFGVDIVGAAGTVDNAGSISGNLGVYLKAGGLVDNYTGGVIAGSGTNSVGVEIGTTTSGAGTVLNAGSISGVRGVYLRDGGSLTNYSSGIITGSGSYGVELAVASGTVFNAGTISGGKDAIDFAHSSGNRLILEAGASFSGIVTAAGTGNVIELASSATAGTLSLGSEYVGFQTVSIDSGSDWAVAGAATAVSGVTIAGFGTTDTLDITNLAFTAGATAVLSGSTLTVTSGGSIVHVAMTGAAGTFFYAHNFGGDVEVTNGKTQITGTHGSGIALSSATYASPVTVDSGAAVSAGSGYALSAGSYWTIENYGSISRTGSGTTGGGIGLTAGGLVENEAGGIIKATAPFGVYITGSQGTVENAGSIVGNSVGNSDGVAIKKAGLVSNAASGVITAGSATVSSNGIGVFMIGGGTVENAGSIYGHQAGIFLNGGLISNASTGTIVGKTQQAIKAGTAAATIENAGSISGPSIQFLAGGFLSNAASGVIVAGSLGVVFANVAGTAENAGSISGTLDAVYFSAHTGANRLIVDAGATFSGLVKANASATNTIELASSGSVGTLSGLSSEYVGFQTLTIDSGAAWEIAGTVSDLDSAPIGGFNADDSLYITNLSYVPGATATLSGNSISVTSGSTTVTFSTPNATGSRLYVHDVGGDVLVNESTVACYCRGTLVKTDRGPVAVEDLAAGDRLVTLSGELRPLKWIGRRSYAGWLAAGNPDVQPVLFKAGSLADNVPSRDLMVSPEHAMFIDGALIPAHHLVNGVSIIQTRGLEEIHYFHLELEDHAVIFAEDAASETYVDDGNRFMFHNVYDYYAECPDAPRGSDAAYCAPRIEDGFELEAVRRALSARGRRLRPDGTAAPAAELRGALERVTRTLVEGWAQGPDPLVILDNGAVIGRVTAGPDHRFRFAIPTGFWPEVRHEIDVRREHDWTLLQGSGAVLEPEALAA